MFTYPFGKLPSGETVTAYAIHHENGVSATILDYGCTLQSLCVKDKNGDLVDVVLGYDNLAGYLQNAYYFGATIGRYGNRIAGGTFTLGDTPYTLAVNNGCNHLHGGMCGFDKKIWVYQASDRNSVTLTLTSPDGEEGYPGNLTVSVTVCLTDDGTLSLTYNALCDADTPLSLTNHTYFNLDDSDDAMAQTLQLSSTHFLSTDATGVPTGEMEAVEGTPFDFTVAKRIGQDLEHANMHDNMHNDAHDGVHNSMHAHPQITVGHGYDHTFCLNNDGKLADYAQLTGEKTGITMRCATTEPGVQLYTANFVEPHRGKNGKTYLRRSAVCLETQKFPNSPNMPTFPCCILQKDVPYTSKTVYACSVK